MEASYLIGVDVGVSFVKAGVYAADGSCLATVQNVSPGEYPEPGVFIQSNADYLDAVTKTLRETVEKAGIDRSRVEAVGISGAMGGATGVDKDWNVVLDWSIISDTRYYPYVTRMKEKAGEQILRLSGTNFPIFGPKLLWWKHDFASSYNKVRKFMFLGGYLIGTLCELSIEDAFVDRTFLQISSLADIAADRWSDELCRAFGIEASLLPRIVDSHTVVGKLSPKYTDACGLAAGTPFVAGAGDKPAGSIGAGLVEPGILVDESASFAALSLCVDTYAPDLEYKTLENMPSPIKGHYFPWFYLIGSGVTHAWFKDNFAGELQLKGEPDRVSAFQRLDEEASAIPPGSEGLLALGLLGGRGFPSDPDIRGMWLGHTWSHKRAHFYRALLESFAYEYACVLNVMKKTYPDISLDEVRIIGGGARSDLWNQIKSDVMGLKYVKLSRDDFALLGDIIIAGHAVGVYKDMKMACRQFVEETEDFTPQAENHRIYKDYVRYYSDVFDKVRGMFQDLQRMGR